MMERVSTFRELHYSSYAYFTTEVRTIYNITINSASLSDSTSVASTIGYQNVHLKEGAR